MTFFKKLQFVLLLILTTTIFGQSDFQRFSVLPFAAYSEETKIQYGGIFILFFKPFGESDHVTSMDFLARGTTRGQFQFQYAPNFWTFKDKLHIPAKFSFYKWQYSLFERGSRGRYDPIDEYNNTFFYGKIPIEMSFGLNSNLRYGIVIEGETRQTNFSSNTPKNYQDGYYLGAGYLLVADKSNNVNWPTDGYYGSFEQSFFGGDFSFHTETVDLRFYAPLHFETSLALGLYFKQSRGENVPLGKLAGPDGTKRFRGVESSIWSDTQALILQAEIRRPLFWRFAGVLFGETLQSAPYFSEIFKRKIHYAVGIGGRLALNKSQKLHARGDISLVDGKHIGITIDMRESF